MKYNVIEARKHLAILAMESDSSEGYDAVQYLRVFIDERDSNSINLKQNNMNIDELIYLIGSNQHPVTIHKTDPDKHGTPTKVTKEKRCYVTNQIYSSTVNYHDYIDYMQRRELVQRAFPYLSHIEREFWRIGDTTPDEYNMLFPNKTE